MIYNLMPEVFWIGPLMVALILRPATALVLAALAIKTIRGVPSFPRTGINVTVAAIYAVLATLIFLGLFTQYAALLGIIFISNVLLWGKRLPSLPRESVLLYILLEAVLFSLFVTGAGPLALDSPL